VNSARATRGGDIEETATRTNLEAADEIGRQMRLRDLGGLIVVDFIDMEESKNRREVEQRLRDALRSDRARVQISSISKFGLLELSRQRLRPALSEGSHITCPRCNGTGHIRDTESSALQILRIIQEESMKDNTAAVHVQVPVEVTSFLLNEKRTEITKIELKQRVTVLLVPNKNLETPNYKLERLRHDDPRLENLQASYTMIEESDDEVGITRREKTKPKQEPVIKGVLPDQPAPVAPPKPEPEPVASQPIAHVPAVQAATPASGGFFGWIKRLFASPEPTIAAPATPATTEPAAAPNQAGEGRGNNRRGRGQRGERGDRSERGDRPEREGRNGRRNERGESQASGENKGAQGAERAGRGERGERGDRTERGEGRNNGAEGRQDGRQERRPRGESRGNREERREVVAAPAEQDVAQQNAFVDTVPNFPAAEGEPEEREGGRRRRRRGGRRGERDAEGLSNSQVLAGEALVEQAAQGASVDSSLEAQASAETEGAQPDESADAGEARDPSRRRRSRDRYRRDRRDRAEGSLEEGASADEQVSADQAEAHLQSAEAAGDAPGSTAQLAASPAVTQLESAHSAPAEIPPAVVTAPSIKPFELPLGELDAIAASAGLVWVNSDVDKIRVAREAIANEPRAVHAPRERKAAVILDDGPLVLVETRKDLSLIKLPFESASSGHHPHQ
jgi:ribonuclease E